MRIRLFRRSRALAGSDDDLGGNNSFQMGGFVTVVATMVVCAMLAGMPVPWTSTDPITLLMAIIFGAAVVWGICFQAVYEFAPQRLSARIQSFRNKRAGSFLLGAAVIALGEALAYLTYVTFRPDGGLVPLPQPIAGVIAWIGPLFMLAIGALIGALVFGKSPR